MPQRSDFFITPDELVARLGEPTVSIADASWYLPVHDRDPKAEFAAARVPGAVYFDIDQIADTGSGLPHTLPGAEQFAAQVGALGIAHDHDIVVYDGPGIFSCARAWWMFRVFGARSVRILEGGFDRWREAGRPLETGDPAPPMPATFDAELTGSPVIDKSRLLAMIERGNAAILDARPSGRFTGEEPEPREGLASGHMPGAISLPFSELVKDGKLLNNKDLSHIFDNLDDEKPIVTTCGSGVTAAAITLALETLGRANHVLYDGSWAEWGGDPDLPVETGPGAKIDGTKIDG